MQAAEIQQGTFQNLDFSSGLYSPWKGIHFPVVSHSGCLMLQHLGRVRAELSEELEMHPCGPFIQMLPRSIIFALSLQAAPGQSSHWKPLPSADRVCAPTGLTLTAGHTSPIRPFITTNYSPGRESCNHSLNLFRLEAHFLFLLTRLRSELRWFWSPWRMQPPINEEQFPLMQKYLHWQNSGVC